MEIKDSVVYVFIGYFIFSVLVILFVIMGRLELPIGNNDYEIEQCKDLTTQGTARCLVNYVSGFYNYKERVDIPKSLENIKENGGDCYDYSVLYKNMAKSLGFRAKTIEIYEAGGKVGHQITIIWNRNDASDYCIIDQGEWECL